LQGKSYARHRSLCYDPERLLEGNFGMSERTEVEMGTVADADVMVQFLKASEAFFNAGLARLSPERQQYITMRLASSCHSPREFLDRAVGRRLQNANPARFHAGIPSCPCRQDLVAVQFIAPLRRVIGVKMTSAIDALQSNANTRFPSRPLTQQPIAPCVLT
jgi:hypothetical protein